MEINYMLAYGSAEASLRLLWKFGILEILLPIQVSDFTHLLLCLYRIFASLCLSNFNIHRQHISFTVVSRDVTKGLTCFW